MVRKYLQSLLMLFVAALLLLLGWTSIGVAAPAAQDQEQDRVGEPASAGQQANDTGEEYVVQRGDSLSAISNRFYGTPADYLNIVTATNAKASDDSRFLQITDPGVIQVGQRLWIPDTPELPIVRPLAIVAEAPSAQGVRFVSPLDGASVPPTFTVQMAAEGLVVESAGEINEGAGHFHILVDSDFVAAGELIPFDDDHRHFSRGQMTTTLALAPGVHTLRLQLGNGGHFALAGDQYRDEIEVTVGEAPSAQGVRFVSPLDGASVPPTFTVQMAAEGLVLESAGEINEGAGHFHILVDSDFVAAGELIPFDDDHRHFSRGQMTTTLALAPGVHTLRLQLGNGGHFALAGDQYRDEIEVTVAEAPSAQGVRFVSPLDGASVPPTFTVQMAAEGLVVESAGEINEGAGHFHILVDSDFVAAGELIPFDDDHRHFSRGQMTTTLALAPGVHTLRLQLGNGGHFALAGDQYRDEIEVTVAEAPSAQGVRFVSPLDGASVPPTFTVQMAAEGLVVESAGEINEGAGHFHILVDSDFVAPGELIPFDDDHRHFSRGQMTTTLALAPGVHTLRLQFGNGGHFALAGDQYRAEVTVTVK